VRGSGFNAKSKPKFILTTTAVSPFSALLPQQQIDSRIENSMKEKIAVKPAFHQNGFICAVCTG
jgi:hypothetical protein